MPDLQTLLRANLAEVAAAHHYRRRRVVTLPDPATPMVLRVNGQSCLNFCSNDYLGLSTHPAIRQAFAAAAQQSVGSGAAHLVTGHSAEHHALEAELAAFTGRERALLFSTGYMANLAVASALLRRSDAVFEDRLNHASLLDSGLLSGARFSRYAHADVAALTNKLLSSDAERKLVLTDGVFSMDGDVAPLTQLAATCQQQDAWLMVDDAHGFGVLGAQGQGSVAEAGLTQDDVPIYMATLGKAAGVFGAFVAGSEELIEWLIQAARTYVFTTATPPAIAAASRAALQVIAAESWRRDHLLALIKRFRAGAEQLGLNLLPSPTAIQPIVLGDATLALQASEKLLRQGLLVSAIRPPTVPANTARLRITLSAAHSEAQVDQLLEALQQLPVARISQSSSV